jgi:hypothetical protein
MGRSSRSHLSLAGLSLPVIDALDTEQVGDDRAGTVLVALDRQQDLGMHVPVHRRQRPCAWFAHRLRSAQTAHEPRKLRSRAVQHLRIVVGHPPGGCVADTRPHAATARRSPVRASESGTVSSPGRRVICNSKLPAADRASPHLSSSANTAVRSLGCLSAPSSDDFPQLPPRDV